MGSGTWTASAYTAYRSSTGVTTENLSKSTVQQLYRSNHLAKELNPYKITRECRDTDEHPYTVPVIIGLDVTGSMGSAAESIAKQLNGIMTELYKSIKDVEFCFMGIGDLSYDDAPIQMSQFESDTRIAEQLEKTYFEGGGGGNTYESYTGVWYMAAHHTDLDCWKRGKKGLIITLGDEPLNPYLPRAPLQTATGDTLQAHVETKELYPLVTEKYEVFHFIVNDPRTSYRRYKERANESWSEYLGADHLKTVTCDSLGDEIIRTITNHAQGFSSSAAAEVIGTPTGTGIILNENGNVVW